jgi:D-alanyl-D-alanine carboxypeptidase
MINLATNIVALFFSVWAPLANTSYISGPILGKDACIEEARLPDSPDLQSTQVKSAPEIEARSFAVLTDEGHIWLAEKNSTNRQAIASITKLMTALVFLDHNPGWEVDYTIKREDLVNGGRVHLYLGDTVSLRDLFNSALVASDNGSALALARATGLSDEDFVAAMNSKARSLGLLQTSFADPIGLSNANISNAKDVARLAQVALNQVDIAEAVIRANYRFNTKQGREKFLESTDWLLDNNENRSGNKNFEALGGKTGYTEAAGYSFVSRFKDDEGRSIIVVVLDSGSRNERFLQSRQLAEWAFNYCQW